jgi:hypothetical protein
MHSTVNLILVVLSLPALLSATPTAREETIAKRYDNPSYGNQSDQYYAQDGQYYAQDGQYYAQGGANYTQSSANYTQGGAAYGNYTQGGAAYGSYTQGFNPGIRPSRAQGPYGYTPRNQTAFGPADYSVELPTQPYESSSAAQPSRAGLDQTPKHKWTDQQIKEYVNNYHPKDKTRKGKSYQKGERAKLVKEFTKQLTSDRDKAAKKIKDEEKAAQAKASKTQPAGNVFEGEWSSGSEGRRTPRRRSTS